MKRKYTPAQKETILNTPNLLGESIRSICKKTGITPKTFYDWKKKYEKGGIDALAIQPKIKRLTKTHQEEIRTYILSLSLKNPHFSPAALAANAKKDNVSISSVTVRKILDSEKLVDIKNRYIRAEKSFDGGNRDFTASQIAQLVKNNPCLQDLPLCKVAQGLPVFVGVIPINRHFSEFSSHIVVFVELNSLFIKAFLYPGNDSKLLLSFYEEAAEFFSTIHPSGRVNILRTDEVVLRALPLSSTSYLKNYDVPSIYKKIPGGFKVVSSEIKTNFIPKALENDISTLSDLQKVLDVWVSQHNAAKRDLFPNFGMSPSAIISKIQKHFLKLKVRSNKKAR